MICFKINIIKHLNLIKKFSYKMCKLKMKMIIKIPQNLKLLKIYTIDIIINPYAFRIKYYMTI